MTAPGRQGSALVIGEALVDVVIHPGQEPREIPGGSSANVALGLARLGRDAELHCWIGTDERGKAVRAHLEASGVRLAPGADGAERTSTAQATIGEDRAATYLFDLDWNPPRPVLADGQAPLLVHTGSIAAILAPGAATVEQVLRETRATSTIAYDPNARPQLMGEPEDAREIVERLVTLSDLVKCSDEDIAWLYGEDADLETVLRSWLDAGAAVVVVTRGKHGSDVTTASGVRFTKIPGDVAVVDTVGAGDSFMGGILDAMWGLGLAGTEGRSALENIGLDAVKTILDHASKVSDVTVSRAGANPPWADELD